MLNVLTLTIDDEVNPGWGSLIGTIRDYDGNFVNVGEYAKVPKLVNSIGYYKRQFDNITHEVILASSIEWK